MSWYDQYYMRCRKRRLPRLRTILIIFAIMWAYSWASNRDRAYQEEIARLSEIALDCMPEIEMSMPIDTMGIQA